MPAQDPILDPHALLHVPYHEADNRFGAGFILPGHDGDPPDAFYTSADFVKVADLATIDFDLLVTQVRIPHTFIFRGSASVALSDYIDFVVENQQCVYAVAVSAVSPSGSAVTINFQYEGVDVLSTPISINAGTAAGQRVYSTAFAVPTLTLPNALDPCGSLTARIVATDSGDTAANITAALVCQRLAA